MNCKQHGFLQEAFQSNRPKAFPLLLPGITAGRFYKGNLGAGFTTDCSAEKTARP